MRFTLRRTLLTVSVVTLVAACTDLTTEPKSTISSVNVFNEAGSYRAFVAKIYAGMAVSGQQGAAGSGDIQGIDEGFSQYLRLLWQMQELPTDEAAIAWNDAGVQELNTQLWSSSNQFLGSMYYRVYFQVAMANEFLRESTDEKMTARGQSAALKAEVKTYRAEARVLRAMAYWHGIDLFGPIPLVTETTALGKTPPAQATRQAIYDYIVAEIVAAAPDLPAARAGEYGRIDQGGAAMLLANVYLNAAVYTGTARYSEARAEAEKAIAGGYTLDPNFRRMFSADNDKSPELIYTIPQDGTHTQSFGGTTFLVHASVGGSMNASAYGIDGGWYGLRLKPEILSLFPGGATSTTDKRSAFFYPAGQTTSMANLTDFSHGVGAPKFTNVTSAGVPGSNGTHPDTDYPMFRLGEAYLIYVEAVTRGGGGSRATALGYVNALRARAYGNATGAITDAQMTTDFVLDERARELLWEGHRRTDLIRYGRFTTAGVWAWKGNVVGGRTTEAFRNLYPLPASELLANPNLKQNTGY